MPTQEIIATIQDVYYNERILEVNGREVQEPRVRIALKDVKTARLYYATLNGRDLQTIHGGILSTGEIVDIVSRLKSINDPLHVRVDPSDPNINSAQIVGMPGTTMIIAPQPKKAKVKKLQIIKGS